jgi:predicted ATPase
MDQMHEINGISIQGFRSFYGSEQKIFPLSQVTAVAGINNSGKSNVFRACHSALGAINKSGKKNIEIDSLDRPVAEGGIQEFRFGISVSAEGDPVEFLAQCLGKLPQRTSQGWEMLEVIAKHPGFYDPESDSFWCYWVVQGVGFSPDPRQFKGSELIRVQDRSLSRITSDAFSTSGSAEDNLCKFRDAVASRTRIPQVHIVPAVRDIRSTGEQENAIINLSGAGLPEYLHTLHSPAAVSYVEDSKKFRKINRFLKSVLQEDSAEIAIPYNSETVHVSLGGQVLPLENLGSGISQAVLISTVATVKENSLVCIEEPEVNMHPLMLRRLVKYLREETSNTYLVSTHSAHMMDDPEVSVISLSYSYESGTEVKAAITETERFKVVQALGYRASDLLQANSIIWVEGPSDRIYLNAFIAKADPNLIEGIHYSVMFYGGRLLSHLSGEEYYATESDVDKFISLIKINRNMAIMIDSDMKQEDDGINETKARIKREFEQGGGLCWITRGREIENYVPADIFKQAASRVHQDVQDPSAGAFENRFSAIKVSKPDKVRIAEFAVAEYMATDWDQLDLSEQVSRLVEFVRSAN